MKTYVSRHKPFLIFLGKFFLAYVILTVGYQYYLSGFDQQQLEVDPITKSIGGQTQWLLELFSVDAKVIGHPKQPALKIIYNGKYVARIIEGCNAVSVMILFAAFVVAFTGRTKQTILFILAGCLLIHLLNIGRIALLSSMIFHFPEHENFLHGVIFPLIIYSVVFILWVIWVNKFSKYAKKAV